MSHAATNWAIEQRGLKPAAKIVLWRLCDRYNPDRGCFPEQATLAADCEMSRSSLNHQLETLEKAGLIYRERRTDGRTKKQISTRYRFSFEPDFPSPESGHGAVSKKVHEPCPENDDSRVQNLDTNPVREPVIEPVIEREGAREAEKGRVQDRKRIEHGFKRSFAKWPTYVSDSEDTARTAWQALTDDERTQAEERIGDYCEHTKLGGRTKTPAFARYLSEKQWERLPERAEPPEPVRIRLSAAPFGKLFGMTWLRAVLAPPASQLPKPPDLLASLMQRPGDEGRKHRMAHQARYGWPNVNWMFDQAHRRVPVDAPLVLDGFEFPVEQMPSDGPQWAAWQREFEWRGWPWPDKPWPEWAWMPQPAAQVIGTEQEQVRAAIHEFEQALKAAGLMPGEEQNAERASNDGAAA